jgi:hypothetical protein
MALVETERGWMGWRMRGVGAGRHGGERCDDGVSEVWGGGGGGALIHSSPSCQATTAARPRNLAVRQDRRTGGAPPGPDARARCASMTARRVGLVDVVMVLLRSQMVLLLCGGQAVVPMTLPGIVSAETADRVPSAIGTGYRNSEPI